MHRRRMAVALCFFATLGMLAPSGVHAQDRGDNDDWEITAASTAALERGLAWLARNQGPNGNWDSNDLGLVSMGALAFLAAGHGPGRGKYDVVVKRALDYIVKNASPSGLLNIAGQRRDMYNHGLATFVLGQAYGMSNDRRIGTVLSAALKTIVRTQCNDGGWDYVGRRQERGHDLSLAVMQAKALRSAMDSGFEVPPEVVQLAIRSVRDHYRSQGGQRQSRSAPGQFTYDGNRGSIAMAACGVVCLQEFGEYDDWRIPKSLDVVHAAIRKLKKTKGDGTLPFDAYSLYYVGQALYQVGGHYWRQSYPRLRDFLVSSQRRSGDARTAGSWRAGKHVSGKPGDLYGTAVGCFILAIPNRYLPILQEGKIASFDQQSRGK